MKFLYISFASIGEKQEIYMQTEVCFDTQAVSPVQTVQQWYKILVFSHTRA